MGAPAPTHSAVRVASLLLGAGESPDSPLGLCPEGKERGCLFLLLGAEVQALSVVSMDTMGGGSSLLATEDESPGTILNYL